MVWQVPDTLRVWASDDTEPDAQHQLLHLVMYVRRAVLQGGQVATGYLHAPADLAVVDRLELLGVQHGRAGQARAGAVQLQREGGPQGVGGVEHLVSSAGSVGTR